MDGQERMSLLTADTYFLIQRFLSVGPLKKTLQVLNNELEEFKLFPKRLDFEGNEHDRTIEDMVQQFANIRPDHLMQLCYQACSLNSVKCNQRHLTSLLSFRTRGSSRTLHKRPLANANLVNALRDREICGPARGGAQSTQGIVTPQLYSGLQMQRVTLGHLSAVYCIIFDRSGRYVITGADDLLIKLWSVHTGRLIASFRGASSEITDIDINVENTLLAAGSVDRILRVWNMQTGVPVAVLSGHTGMIASVNFCPTDCWGWRYLITTSTDGSAAFWSYNYHGRGKAEFRSTPTIYQEKLRPGGAQMICSAFSAGGTFLATGSADHHVRVYYMKGDEGPYRILESEAHSDRVDSVQWAHKGLRFVSGGKDGTAIIWWFEAQQWKSIYLHMSSNSPVNNHHHQQQQQKKVTDEAKKVKVTMVAWDLSDEYVVTAVSDCTLKVWHTNGQLDKVLTGHRDEVYVLETHPHHNHIILSAGHDGQLFVWDIRKGEIVFRFLNTIEGQGYGALFDVKWSPDGVMMGATDSHGDLLLFGFGKGSPFYEQLPKELFFHTDYRPLVRDASNHYVLDEQTQVPPHLMPPPFLVDIDGNPYPPMLQRLVPGREHCNVEQLVPNIVIGNEGTQEVIQDISLDERHQLAADGAAASTPIGNNRNALPRRSRNSRDMERPNNSSAFRHGTPGGDWQSDPHMEWKRHTLVPPLPASILQRAVEAVTEMSRLEVEEYQKQLRQRPHMICTSTAGGGGGAGTANGKQAKKDERSRKRGKYQTRAQRPVTLIFKSSGDSSDESSRHEEALSDSSPSSAGGYSDWMADEGMNLEPPKRSKRRQVLISDDDEEEDEEEELDMEEEEDEDDLSSDSDCRPSTSGAAAQWAQGAGGSEAGSSKKSKRRRKTKLAKSAESIAGSSTASTSGTPATNKKIKVTEKYKLSEWLSETKPRKSPYFPQMGDEVVYFIQGHQLYLEAVKAKDVYEISGKDLPWNKMQIRDREYAKVIGIQYEIKPPRLCCLKLAMMDESGRLTGKIFTVKYHDMPDVLDFFVLKQTYVTSVSRNWCIDDKFRCMIDDEWWIGRIVENSPASDQFPDSPFMCYAIKWLNGETERMSPWDMEPLDTTITSSLSTNEPENTSGEMEDESQALPVLESELNAILYKPVAGDWPNNDRDAVSKQILLGLTKVMELAIAEPFLVPVDINLYPTYAFIIEYPMDLSTIKARFENKFYRRLTAAQFDIRYLATNAEKFNERHSVIVKHARILTELCLRIVKSGANFVDVPAIYHQLVDSYASTDSEEEAAGGVGDLMMPSGSSSRSKMAMRILPSRVLKSPNDWLAEAQQLMDALWNCEDSLPFRAPVNVHKYPDYVKVIKQPMDLGTVRSNLDEGRYETPHEFSKDVRLIFRNSRMYNTNKRSRIYVMTVRLAAIFEEHIIKILHNWKVAKRRQQSHQQRHHASKKKQLKTNRNHRINSSGDDSSSSDDHSSDDPQDGDRDNRPRATSSLEDEDGNFTLDSATDPLTIVDNTDPQICERIEIVEEAASTSSTIHQRLGNEEQLNNDSDDDDLTLNVIKDKQLTSNNRIKDKRKSISSGQSMNDDGVESEGSEDSYKPEEEYYDEEEDEDHGKKANRANNHIADSSDAKKSNRRLKSQRKHTGKSNNEDYSEDEEEESEESGSSSDGEEKLKRPARRRLIMSSNDEERASSSNRNQDSSSNSNSSAELIKYQRRKSKRKPVRRRRIDYNEDDDDDDDSDDDLPLESHRKRRRIEHVDVDANDLDDGNLLSSNDEIRSIGASAARSNSSSCFTTSVSSRGRVRKLTPRAQALMKAPHKFV